MLVGGSETTFWASWASTEEKEQTSSNRSLPPVRCSYAADQLVHESRVCQRWVAVYLVHCLRKITQSESAIIIANYAFFRLLIILMFGLNLCIVVLCKPSVPNINSQTRQ